MTAGGGSKGHRWSVSRWGVELEGWNFLEVKRDFAGNRAVEFLNTKNRSISVAVLSCNLFLVSARGKKMIVTCKVRELGEERVNRILGHSEVNKFSKLSRVRCYPLPENGSAGD